MPRCKRNRLHRGRSVKARKSYADLAQLSELCPCRSRLPCVDLARKQRYAIAIDAEKHQRLGARRVTQTMPHKCTPLVDCDFGLFCDQ